MTWLWQNYQPDGLYRVDWRPLSPALEVSEDPRSVNILLRFEKIFQHLAEAGICGNMALEDALLRFLALLDLSCGLDARELELLRLDEEILHGLWGEDAQKWYEGLESQEQRNLLHLLREQEKTHQPLFDRAIAIFFPNSRAYKLEKTGEILLSIPKKKCVDAINRVALIQALFLPFRQSLSVYWQKTPCLLDAPEAALDCCVLG